MSSVLNSIDFDFDVQQSKVVVVNDEPIEENLNRLEPETIDARGIEEAIAALRFVY